MDKEIKECMDYLSEVASNQDKYSDVHRRVLLNMLNAIVHSLKEGFKKEE